VALTVLGALLAGLAIGYRIGRSHTPRFTMLDHKLAIRAADRAGRHSW
jgi:hypothetical protein